MKKLLAVALSMAIFPAYAVDWQCINRNIGMCNTWRMVVPHGWIVASDNSATTSEHGYAMVYVPDENHDWILR